jgi:prepilin-type N-terminal cleavage/methylation domain-containing protein
MEKRGFSLIELIVVTAIFAIVFGTAISIFVSSLQSQRRILAHQQLLDSISYSIEYMSRALRMAKKNNVGDVDCGIGDKVNYYYDPDAHKIRFRDYNDKCHEFYLLNNCYPNAACLMENIEGVYTSPLPITPNDLNVTSFNISLSGQEQTDNLQPRVTIVIDAQLKVSGQPKIKVQTSVSQRSLDVPK